MKWPAVVNEWGSTPAERAAPYACDALVPRPDAVMWRALDVDAPNDLVYRWLCQMRVAPYSYDWIDNAGRRSPRHLVDGLDQLEIGQRIATIFRIRDFEPFRSITFASKSALFGHVAITYDVTPIDAERSRLVVKLLLGTRRSPFGCAMRLILPPGDLVMMRKQLLNLRALAERDAREIRSGRATRV